MADNTSHRRNLAAPHPQKPMDPTQRNPKPNPSTGKNHHHLRHHPQPLIHPLPDPTIAPPSTIQNISHRFSKLYANHKKLASHSSKPGPHPQPDPHFRTAKDLPSTPVSDTSCTTLTKSSSQKSAVARKIMEKTEKFEKNYYFATKTKVGQKDGLKPSFEKYPEKNPSPEPPELILKCLENEDVRGFGGGGGVVMGKRRSSLSCIPPTVSGGRRRSFCNSQVELADFLSCSGVKVVAVDMPPFMQVHAVDCARKAHDSLEKFTSKTLAYTLKKEFDGEYGPAWHCIVGTSFGSFVTHSVGGFMYFSMDHKLYILLFKTTVQRAE